MKIRSILMLLAVAFSSATFAQSETFTTRQGITVKKTVVSKASPKRGPAANASPGTNGWGNCGLVPDAWECAGDIYTSYFSFDSYFGGSAYPIELKRVTIDGQSTCSILVEQWLALPGCGSFSLPFGASNYYDNLSPEGKEGLGGTVDEILADTKLLPTCIVVPTAANLAADPQYVHATYYFKEMYLPNIAGVEPGNQVDVRYSGGAIVRFTVQKIIDQTQPDPVIWKLKFPALVGYGTPSPCPTST